MFRAKSATILASYNTDNSMDLLIFSRMNSTGEKAESTCFPQVRDTLMYRYWYFFV